MDPGYLSPRAEKARALIRSPVAEQGAIRVVIGTSRGRPEVGYHSCMMGPLGMSLTALGLYVAAEAFSIGHLRTDRDGYGRMATLLLLLGFLVHFLALEVGGRAEGTVPYQNLPGSLSLFAWMLAAAYGILFLRHREGSTGPFLIPLVILFMAASLLVHSSQAPHAPRDPMRSGSLFAMHVTLAILGYAGFTLSFVLAQMYLLQTRQLHRHNLGLLFSRLPALDVLTRMHRTSVAMAMLIKASGSKTAITGEYSFCSYHTFIQCN